MNASKNCFSRACRKNSKVVTTLKKSEPQKWTWSGARFTRQTASKKQLDTSNRLQLYKRARYYDTKTGEFISQDPLEYLDGMSMYRGYFVPNGWDPTGTSYGPGPDETLLEWLERLARSCLPKKKPKPKPLPKPIPTCEELCEAQVLLDLPDGGPKSSFCILICKGIKCKDKAICDGLWNFCGKMKKNNIARDCLTLWNLKCKEKFLTRKRKKNPFEKLLKNLPWKE